MSYVWSEDIRETAAALLAHFEERNDVEGLESAYVMWDQFCVNHHSETGYSNWDEAIKCRDTLAVSSGSRACAAMLMHPMSRECVV